MSHTRLVLQVHTRWRKVHRLVCMHTFTPSLVDVSAIVEVTNEYKVYIVNYSAKV